MHSGGSGHSEHAGNVRAFRRMLWGNCVSTFSNIMVRRSLVNGSTDIIMEPEGFQDWMLLLLSRRCCFYHSSRTKTFWRRRANSIMPSCVGCPDTGDEESWHSGTQSEEF